jgi:pilus assembly protein Flp/PilA
MERSLEMLMHKSEKAQSVIEYALIIVLVAVVLIVVLSLVGSQISTVFSQIISGLTPASLP